MIGLALVRSLEEDWRDVLDAVARRRGWPTSREAARLAARVAELSAAYNDPARARAAMRDAGPARLGFAFARDVPKSAAAVRELIATGRLRLEDGGEPMRVLDVGAGLGATTWGVVRALIAAGGRGTVEATWVDSDASALELGEEIVRARGQGHGSANVELRVKTSRADLASLAHLGPFDLVLAGQLLSELDVNAPETGRVEVHSALVARWLERNVREHGSLVLVEPALRDRTRHLHRVRDALAASGATVFAPCLHAASCPALSRESDWCHEDLPVDVPVWLVPVARAAGLRREGLTFSYLVLRKDGAHLADEIPSAGEARARLRVVSESMRTKGKREAFVCGEFSTGGAGPTGPTAATGGAGQAALVPGRARAMRLDRDASQANAAWEHVVRGDLLCVSPPPELERPRIGERTSIESR
jgi:ribosomal protein RSM22 (predicted rRNA methylase)